ncbi:conditioned medium-induced protein 4 [Halobacterium noricense]|uniref:conditioned medium-induced protein 4 n=1 Tax=Halobacterium noricense TaxID=223182 RepID=UPI001E32642F|nr:conditioned medium-induced protein 4 [Halobacterium noricense]UHH25156.1 conditioned medium-induced protein 4 [Halobacterium noricense]
MDEKTEELRDIFVDVADGDTVTESQEETHGSLASEADVEARLRETVAEMREDLDFETSLSVDELTTLVERFYDEDGDADIADELGARKTTESSSAAHQNTECSEDVDEQTVIDARLDLHLLREADTDAPLDRVRDADESVEDLADELGVRKTTESSSAAHQNTECPEDVDVGTIRHYQRVVETREERRRLNDRYRAEFENALQDRELSERLTSSVHEDGLEGATEGQETNIDI